MANMDDIKNAMAKKNAMISKAGAAQPQAQNPIKALEGVIASPNAQATPQSVAKEADIISAAAKAKFEEYDKVFAVMLPAMDKLKVEHDMIMQALQAAGQPIPQAPAPTAPAPILQ